jgi:hypothetical protein
MCFYLQFHFLLRVILFFLDSNNKQEYKVQLRENRYNNSNKGVVSMQWDEVRTRYPDQWVLIEALKAHTAPDLQRYLDQLSVIEPCSDGRAAMDSYRRYHQLYPQREFYFVHTSRKVLDIREKQWVGIRHTYAA